MKTLGPCLALFYYTLTFGIAYIYLETMVPLSVKTYGLIKTAPMVFVGMWILFCVTKAHIKAMWSNPGFVSRYYVSYIYLD